MRVVECHRRGCASVRPVLIVSVVLALVGMYGRMAAGQAAPANPAAPQPASFRELPVDANAEKTLKTQASRLLRSPQLGQNEQTILDRYYQGYVLARWSLVADVARLSGYRSELRRALQTAGSGPTHDYLVNLVLTQMRVFAKQDFHKAVRFNAMLMIGELNAVEGRATVPPTPLPAALNDLLEAVGDPQQLQAVKVAALAGIIRHARLGGIKTPAAQTEVTNAMLSVLGAQGAAANGSTVGRLWMRGQAAEVLGLLGAVGNNGDVATALASLAADSKLPLSPRSRCMAAEALGKLNYQGAAGLKASQLARALGQLAVDACRAETPAVSRRRLRGRLLAVSTGFGGSDAQHKGVAALATGQQQQFVASLQQSLAAMLTHVADDQIDNRQMMQRVGQEAANLESELSKAALATN